MTQGSSESSLAKRHEFSRETHSELKRSEKREFLSHYVKKNGIGAELGVFWGHFSEVILRTFRPRRLYLVDLWDMQGDSFGNWGAYTDFGRLQTADCHAYVKGLEAQHPGVVTVVRDSAEKFLTEYRGEKFDWVYLDTSHRFDETLRQLELISDHLQRDGVILGDDWIPDPAHPHHDVFRAVHRFIRTADFEIVIAGKGNQFVLRRGGSQG
jgi:predicted O-methyltransferase YrrM